jgi:hypothetical protein
MKIHPENRESPSKTPVKGFWRAPERPSGTIDSGGRGRLMAIAAEWRNDA